MKHHLADGTELVVDIQGQGRPIIFLNGFGGYLEIWTAQLRPLLANGYQTIRFNYRGQGGSSGGYAASIATLACDLADLWSSLNVTRPVIVAHSMGASVLWALRADFPQLVPQAQVIVDQSPKMLNAADWQFGFCDATANNYQKYLTQARGHETLHGLVPEVMRPLISAQLKAPFKRQQAHRLLETHFQADWRAQVQIEQVPTLFISAQQSPYFASGFGKWAAALNAKIQAVTIADCGHDIMAEVPAAFNQTLRHFLRQTC